MRNIFAFIYDRIPEDVMIFKLYTKFQLVYEFQIPTQNEYHRGKQPVLIEFNSHLIFFGCMSLILFNLLNLINHTTLAAS